MPRSPDRERCSQKWQHFESCDVIVCMWCMICFQPLCGPITGIYPGKKCSCSTQMNIYSESVSSCVCVCTYLCWMPVNTIQWNWRFADNYSRHICRIRYILIKSFGLSTHYSAYMYNSNLCTHTHNRTPWGNNRFYRVRLTAGGT